MPGMKSGTAAGRPIAGKPKLFPQPFREPSGKKQNAPIRAIAFRDILPFGSLIYSAEMTPMGQVPSQEPHSMQVPASIS